MRKQKDDMQVNVAGLRRNIKNLAHNYSDAQVKVREATSNDPWGPSATIMAEIADLTYNVVAFSEIMQMIWKRLNDHGKNWRHVYKALILLEYLIKTGTEKVAQQCKENIFAIQTLREFVYYEEGKDQGTHVREKAKQLVNLLKDDERLKNERIKALKAKERFAQHPSGFGSDGYIDGPSQRDMPPGWQEEPKPVSELEMVRPQTAGEEELQLQLAMAMSREEAEQEEAKRRSDDVRLQLALSQSEQDFKEQPATNFRQQTKKPEEPQSHLLDLLDISLGATSISSPPLGAAGGSVVDPWGTPARAASQLSDPWSGTSSPQIDPWHPTAAPRGATAMGGGAASVPLGALGGGMNGGGNDAWALRTHSPSVASGSSPEGWLQTNGNASNGAIGGVAAGGASALDPWLGKTQVAPLAANAPLQQTQAAGASGGLVDTWLADGAAKPEDPWAPKTATMEDPWKSIEQAVVMKKPSPDMDEFDIITMRNKTGDYSSNNSNNNNSSLLDDMDPLSTNYGNLLNTGAGAATTTNAKKPLKTPQAFLGENSSLVNLDNLIKPIQPQTANAAYNPFSDTVIPPKTNLFQQQQPVVPSINQLKQQPPFAMSINQDPWAPVNNSNMTSQQTKDILIHFDSTVQYDNAVETQKPFNKVRPSSLNFKETSAFQYMNNNNNMNNSNSNNNNNNNINKNNNNNNNSHNLIASKSYNNIINDVSTAAYKQNNSTFYCDSNTADAHAMNFNQNIDSIRDLDISAATAEPSLTKQPYHISYYNNSVTPKSSAMNLNNSFQLSQQQQQQQYEQHQQEQQQQQQQYRNNNTNYGIPFSPTTTPALATSPQYLYAQNYSNALQASLAATPGVKIAAMGAASANESTLHDFYDVNSQQQRQPQQQQQFQQQQQQQLYPHEQLNAIAMNSNTNSLGFYKYENNNNTNNNNNNNMPWIKPAEATNPFLT